MSLAYSPISRRRWLGWKRAASICRSGCGIPFSHGIEAGTVSVSEPPAHIRATRSWPERAFVATPVSGWGTIRSVPWTTLPGRPSREFRLKTLERNGDDRTSELNPTPIRAIDEDGQARLVHFNPHVAQFDFWQVVLSGVSRTKYGQPLSFIVVYEVQEILRSPASLARLY